MMTQALRITLRDLPPTPALEAKIRERAQKLARFSHHIIGCHVVVEVPHRHRKNGLLFSVRIDVTVPGGEIVVEPSRREGYSDPYLAVRDAFDAVTRRLEDYERKRRGDVKSHASGG
jgi:ribosomal subunit interface protein